jgi:5-methylcytosine-specific restriction endonuclease McrA
MAKKQRYGKTIVWVNHKRKTFSKAQRLSIFERDNYKCQLCDKDLSNLPNDRIIDHKIPLSKLGSNRIENLWLLCGDCDKNKKSEILPCVVRERLNELLKRTKSKKYDV